MKVYTNYKRALELNDEHAINFVLDQASVQNKVLLHAV